MRHRGPSELRVLPMRSPTCLLEKPRLQLEKFAINGPKRLLQQNLPGTDMRHLSDSQVGGPTDERKRRYQSDR